VEDEPFARYDAVQQLMLSALVDSVASGVLVGHDEVVAALASLLEGWRADPALVAETLLLPAESLVGDRLPLLDPAAVHEMREAMRGAVRAALEAPLWDIWQTARSADPTSLAPHDKGLRRIGAIALSLLMAGDEADAVAAAHRQFAEARTMTERMAALIALSHSGAPVRDEALAAFEHRFARVPDALDRWFGVQAGSSRPDTLERVTELAAHPRFDARNPNRLRALVLGFGMNQARFHRADHAGYAFLAEQVRAIDPLNPQSAARLAAPLTRWRRLMEPYASGMRDALASLVEGPALSPDLQEVVSQSLR
jgi:aminopeptidase N